MTDRLTVGAVIAALERSGDMIGSLLGSISEDAVRWRPGAGRWSSLEIVCHLVDEEIDDFRARTRSTIERPDSPWPPIDPEGWVAQRRYAERDFGERCSLWIEERRKSVSWLRSIDIADWERTYVHPDWGPIRARLILDNWLAHDYLHARQILGNQYEWLRRGSDEDPRYAGDW